jgi:hypothetical protein
MSISFRKIDLAGPVAAFPSDPDFDAGFTGNAAVILYTSAANTEVEVSFDGVHVHGRLLAGTAPSGFWEANTYQKVWLRTVTVGAVSVGVAVESTGKR